MDNLTAPKKPHRTRVRKYRRPPRTAEKHVSVRAETYGRLTAAAQARGISIAALVRMACASILGEES